MSTTAAYARGEQDCAQDAMENVPFGSVGGLERRGNMRPPAYASDLGESYSKAYLAGYRARALAMYGADWETCEFSWKPALTIPGNTRTG